jgi:symplekin
LYNYVIRDFRKRMDIAVAWLNEEWYNDRVLVNTEEGSHRQPQYHKWIMKLMDAIFPFLESRDRLFMRMLSETPEFPPELLEKIKMLCLDPDRTALGIQILQYDLPYQRRSQC